MDQLRVALLLALLLVCSSAFGVSFDCVDTVAQVAIEGESPSKLPDGRPSPFRGVADACIRKDPASNRLWMAYSRPFVRLERISEADGWTKENVRSIAGVEVMLASSTNEGESWKREKTLWPQKSDTDPTGDPGYINSEVANLLPVTEGNGVVWYSARQDYFNPLQGGYSRRPAESFHICISRADTPTGLAEAEAVRLGTGITLEHWRDVDLSLLSPELSGVAFWSEPALCSEGGKLYLLVGGMRFYRKVPDLKRCDLFVFATEPRGTVREWKWQFVGKLAGHAEAKELGGDYLNQMELSRAKDGTLLLLTSPGTWSEKLSDVVHHGCRAVEVASLALPSLARDAQGKLKVRAVVTASDAGPHGTAASAYDPASKTGIVFGKRYKKDVGYSSTTGASPEMSFSIFRTGITP